MTKSTIPPFASYLKLYHNLGLHGELTYSQVFASFLHKLVFPGKIAVAKAFHHELILNWLFADDDTLQNEIGDVFSCDDYPCLNIALLDAAAALADGFDINSFDINSFDINSCDVEEDIFLEKETERKRRLLHKPDEQSEIETSDLFDTSIYGQDVLNFLNDGSDKRWFFEMQSVDKMRKVASDLKTFFEIQRHRIESDFKEVLYVKENLASRLITFILAVPNLVSISDKGEWVFNEIPGVDYSQLSKDESFSEALHYAVDPLISHKLSLPTDGYVINVKVPTQFLINNSRVFKPL